MNIYDNSFNPSQFFLTKEEYYDELLREEISKEDAEKYYPYVTVNKVLEEEKINSKLAQEMVLSTVFQFNCFDYADKWIEEYDGGCWDFYELDNGGAFMALDPDKKFTASCLNYSTKVVSGVAAGYYVSQMILSILMFMGPDRNLSPETINFARDLYIKNKELCFHFRKPDSSSIIALLD